MLRRSIPDCFLAAVPLELSIELIVTWTSGRSIRLTNAPSDQIVTVLEPDALRGDGTCP